MDLGNQPRIPPHIIYNYIIYNICNSWTVHKVVIAVLQKECLIYTESVPIAFQHPIDVEAEASTLYNSPRVKSVKKLTNVYLEVGKG